MGHFREVALLSCETRRATDGAEVAEVLKRKCEKIGRRVWNINTTDSGGGVAEILRSLVPLARAFGLDARWLVFSGSPELFRISKRIYHGLYGHAGDGSDLGEKERLSFESQFWRAEVELLTIVKEGDIVVIHDPQVAGFIPTLVRRGVRVIWRCHLGSELSNYHTELAWNFIRPYIDAAQAFVFLSADYFPAFLADRELFVVEPSINVMADKNTDMTEHQMTSILSSLGFYEKRPFTRLATKIGGHGIVGLENGLRPGRRLAVQVSRWDWLKNHTGLLKDFSTFVESGDSDCDLVLVGPAISSVADDPEDSAVLECIEQRLSECPATIRRRVGIALLPMKDGAGHAFMVNAIQRRADIIIQRSLAEGFGLSVTEGMWKEKAVVASNVGGIRAQISTGTNGVLVESVESFCAAMGTLVKDSSLREAYGKAARATVIHRFLPTHHMLRFSCALESVA